MPKNCESRTEKLSSGAAPSGTVTFQDGTTSLATKTLNSAGQATFTTGSLTVGNHTILAGYRRPGATTPTNTLALIQSVAKANTSTMLTATPTTVGLHIAVTFSATVTVRAPGAGHPSGSVTFSDGHSVLRTATINPNGVATFSTSTLNAGIHTIAASYAGSGSFSASASTAILETVKSSASAVLLGSAAASNVSGPLSDLMVNRFTSAVNAPTQVASVNGTTGAAQTATRAMSGQATASPLPAAGVDAYFARLQKNERSVAVLGAHGEVTVRKEDWLADAL